MKKRFVAAAELFRESEAFAEAGKHSEERASYYRALSLLAEGLQRIEDQWQEIESQIANGPASAGRSPRKLRPRIFVALPAPPP